MEQPIYGLCCNVLMFWVVWRYWGNSCIYQTDFTRQLFWFIIHNIVTRDKSCHVNNLEQGNMKGELLERCWCLCFKFGIITKKYATFFVQTVCMFFVRCLCTVRTLFVCSSYAVYALFATVCMFFVRRLCTVRSLFVCSSYAVCELFANCLYVLRTLFVHCSQTVCMFFVRRLCTVRKLFVCSSYAVCALFANCFYTK